MNASTTTSTATGNSTRAQTLLIAAIAAGVAAIGMAIYQVATPGSPAAASYESLADYVREVLFLTYLLTSVVAVVAARRMGLTPRIPSLLVVVGYALITVGVTIGLLLREELDWFFVVAGPGLLLSTVGFALIGIDVWRRRTLPRWAAPLAGVGGMVAILMSEFGTSVLVGAFWLVVAAWLLRSRRSERDGRSASR